MADTAPRQTSPNLPEYPFIQRVMLFTLLGLGLVFAALYSGKLIYENSQKQATLDRHQHLMNASRTVIQEHLVAIVKDIHQLSLDTCSSVRKPPLPDYSAGSARASGSGQQYLRTLRPDTCI